MRRRLNDLQARQQFSRTDLDWVGLALGFSRPRKSSRRLEKPAKIMKINDLREPAGPRSIAF
jgi:hypothetical protein